METMIQYFEWYLPEDGNHWNRLKEDAANLKRMGFTSVWMPPAYKGQAGSSDVGYGVYDTYDLGEFDAKGSTETKYGTKEEYIAAVKELKNQGLMPIADIVLNHRMGSDGTENIQARDMNWNNRNEPAGDLHDVKVWTEYTFPERDGKYSDFEWGWKDFTGTDYDANTGDGGLLQFEGKEWNQDVSQEQGNFDYIMGQDVDFNSDRVTKELHRWGHWYKDMTGINAYRLDAVKSIDSGFYPGWLKDMESPFAVGEYWTGNVEELNGYLNDCNHCMRLFDVPFHFQLMNLSQSNGNYDVRGLFHNCLDNRYSVPFVDNHDTQPGQSLESWVLPWFKQAAYAIILLRNFEVPCVFYGDLYGIPHDNFPPVEHLDELVWIRQNLLGTDLHEYETNDGQLLAWTVQGDHPILCMVTVGDHREISAQMPDGTYVDVLSGRRVYVNNGWGNFYVDGGKAAVYIKEEDWNAMKEQK